MSAAAGITPNAVISNTIERLEKLLSVDHDDIPPWSVREMQDLSRALLAEWEERGREIERLKDQLQRENAEHTACERIWRGGQEAAEARLAKVVETLGAPGYTPNCPVCGYFATIIGKALAAARREELWPRSRSRGCVKL